VNNNHLNYLHAMGVQCWASREAAVEEKIDFAGDSSNSSTLPAVMDWPALESYVRQCEECSLSESRAQAVLGAGSQTASWMLVTEAPNEADEMAGQPFMGESGRLLTEMLFAVGLTRKSVYITHIVKCRPEGDRNPAVGELDSCKGYLDRQIELLAPKIVLAVGRVAAQSLLNTDRPLSELRGDIHHYGAAKIPLVVIYHPAYLLRSLTEKRKAWSDLQLALEVMA
jgi:DNA polymerase